MASIEKRTRKGPDGQRWRATWRVHYRAPNGKNRSRTFAGEADAKAFAQEVEVDKRRQAWVDPAAGKLLFRGLADEYAAGTAHLKPKSAASDRSALRSRILPAFGEVPIARIDTADVKRWISGMVAEGLSPSRVRQTYNLLVRILETAVTDTPRRLVLNPAKGLKTPVIRRGEILFLSREEVEKLADALEAEQRDAGLIAYIGAYGGPRWGEMAALRRRACSGIGRLRLDITESLAEANGRLYFDATKTYRRRTVDIPPFLSELLAARLMRVPSEPDALVLTTPSGRPLRYSNFKRDVWDPAVAAAGLPARLGPHALRHTCAAILIEEGWHAKEIQAQLGHSSITVTLDTYGHLFPRDVEAKMAALDAGRAKARETVAQQPDAQILQLPARD